MAKVINDVVKLDWEKSGWLQSKASKQNPKGVFIMASQEYENDNGETIPVIFNANTAFIWGDDIGTDDEDIWSVEDLRDWLKTEFNASYPDSYDQYLPIIQSGSLEANTEVLEKYGLMKYKDDIEARLKDLLPYGEETDIG